MKSITDRWKDLGEQVKERNQELPPRLADKMESIRRGDDENEEISLPEAQTPVVRIVDPDENTYLPTCKNTHVPTPNVILRSALFGVVKKGTRQYEKGILKATFNGYAVKYTGEQLDQSDLDVWLECLQRCQTTPLGHTVRFAIHDFLRSIGRNTGKTDHEWLKGVFVRFRACAVEISDDRYEYIGGLVNDIYRDKETGEYCIELHPKISACFSGTSWTGISKNIRLQLKGKPLTLWLHGFYSSHNKPLPMKVSTLKELCGSDRGELRKFRYDLKKSLAELASVTGWQCSIDEHDLVVVKK